MVASNPEARTSRKRVGGNSLYFWVAISFPFVLLGLAWLTIASTIHYLHFWVALPLALLFTAVAVGFLLGVYQTSWIGKKFGDPLPFVSVTVDLSLCLAAALILTTVGAWVSYVLYQYGLAPSVKDSLSPTYDNLVGTYIWHLVDVIPLMNPEKTLGMKDPPVRFIGWTPGIPVLLFRAFVIVGVLAAVRTVWGVFHSTSQDALLARIDKSSAKPQQNVARSEDVA